MPVKSDIRARHGTFSISNMTTQAASDFDQALWDDYDSKSTFPELRRLIAHYTSIETLEKIVNNEEIWFSHPMYMNDQEELIFGMNTGAEYFRADVVLAQACGSSEAHAKLIKEFNRLFHEFGANHAFDTYVACFSEHDKNDDDGRLSMWRGYGSGGGGVAIVFDTAKIQALEQSPLIVGKVAYHTQLEREAQIDKKLSALAAAMQKHQITDEVLNEAARQWIEWLKQFAIFTKHSGFKEEQEWRIVYSSERDSNAAFSPMFGYAITARGVEPKLKLKIGRLPHVIGPQISLENLVDRIILGPTISTILAAKSVRRMLEKSRTPSLAKKVRESSIPFRP